MVHVASHIPLKLFSLYMSTWYTILLKKKMVYYPAYIFTT